MASTLVVEPGPAGSDERDVRVEEARVHPVEASVWVLEMSGQESRDGSRFRDEMLEVSPWELLRRCQGAVGEPRFLPQGIVTPAILFDSLGS